MAGNTRISSAATTLPHAHPRTDRNFVHSARTNRTIADQVLVPSTASSPGPLSRRDRPNPVSPPI
ncbi:hypothetical protein GCM10020218_037940 [Dactylosporangium vinaceum]